MTPLRRVTFSAGARPRISGKSLILSLALALWACSSNIELKPLDQDPTLEGMKPMGDDVAASNAATSGTPSAGQAGDPTAGGELPQPTLAPPAGTGGGPANAPTTNAPTSNAPTTNVPAAGPAPMMAAAGAGAMPNDGDAMAGSSGAPACPDADGDGRCDDVDRCPDVKDDGTDHDGDGIPDACDPCGIGVALGLSPLYYFSLDDTGESLTALNLGSVPQNGTYVGPVERGWAGVADPQGRAPRFLGQAGGEFSRVELLGAPAFPSTALTAMFWVRTSQSGDYVVISYAIAGSSNEFAVIVERDRLIVTLQSSTFQALDIDRNLITDGTWHFVALTWDSTRAQFYFDGEAVGAPLITEAGYEIAETVAVPVTGPLALSPGGVLVLGQDQDSLDGDFSFEQALIGGLDEVAIYDRVLSADQIRSIFTATTCGERCDGMDNDGDGKVDEGFLGSSPACPAPSCGAIAATSGFGPGQYFSSVTPTVPLTCMF